MSGLAGDDDLSVEHLNELIKTLRIWSMSRPWTRAQTAAWRLRWFGRTPEQDQDARERYMEDRASELERGFDRYERPEREPFNDWPNGMGE